MKIAVLILLCILLILLIVMLIINVVDYIGFGREMYKIALETYIEQLRAMESYKEHYKTVGRVEEIDRILWKQGRFIKESELEEPRWKND